MNIPKLTFLLLTFFLPLCAQEEFEAVIPEQQATSIDVPDPYAIHTPKGKILEQPVLSGEDISIMYYQLTGKRVLLSSAFRGVEISIIQPGPITNQEVTELIESQLMMEGFTLMETPGKPNQLRLLPLNGAKQGGIKVVTDPDKIPYNDELISYTMRLNFIKPEEAIRIFQSVIGQFNAASSISPVPNASSLIITDNALLVRSIIDLKNQIDVPSTNVSTKFVKLIYADAEEVAEQLNELINNQESTTSGVQRNTPIRQNNVQGNNAAISAGQGTNIGEDIPLKILADSRTNRITLLGSSDKIIFAESLISEIDQPTSKSGFIRHKLKYLPVAEFIPIAAQALEATLGGDSQGGGNNRSQGTNNTSNQNNNSEQSGGANGRAAVGGQDGNTAPDSQLIGKTLLVADNISNSIIVDGPPHHIEIVKNLINELDRKSEQIAITAIFGTYGSGNVDSFSTNAVALYDQVTGSPRVGGGTIPGFDSENVSNIFTADSLSSFTAATLATGFNVGFANTDYGVFVNALKTTSDFEEISRPTVFTTNNRSARISSGSRIAVPTGRILDSGTSSTNIEYIDVVLELEVRPLVNSETDVTLEVAVVKDSLGNLRNVDGVETNDINTQELSTIVTVPNKSLILLGGLYTGNDRESESKVPILGQIPLLGKLFTSSTDDENLDELVIMIHTHVVGNDNDLNDFQTEYDNHSYIAPETRDKFRNNDILKKLKKDNGHDVDKNSNSTRYRYDRITGPRKGSRMR